MSFQPSFHDIAHLGHVELFTPKPEESLAFFKNIIGLHESGRSGDSVFLRAWGDYQKYTLQLTAARTSGLGHVALRAKSAQTLAQLAEHLTQQNIQGTWLDDQYGHGPAFRFPSPDGHQVEIYYETERFVPQGDAVPGFKNQPSRYIPSGIAPRRLDHINILAKDVKANREMFHQLLGMRVTEQIIFDDGTEVGAWLSATNKSYDFAITQDRSGARGRFHHLTYFMDSREDVLRAADVLVERGVFIETGPHKHNIGQTFFLYCYEPGGNRFEIAAGGYLIFDPDWKPVVWTQADRAKGQAWGLQTVSSFHTYGTPPVGASD
ncbi:MAG: catechol 2,3-dioxygenase [Candidatus Solibacter sp.]|nr:catechol 2,3-dioxygenase [Candidatus Solibacter sp.]